MFGLRAGIHLVTINDSDSVATRLDISYGEAIWRRLRGGRKIKSPKSFLWSNAARQNDADNKQI